MTFEAAFGRTFFLRMVLSGGVGACLLLGTTGCETTRETLGMNKKGPDEFADMHLPEALVVPPAFDVLPKPKIGDKEQDPFPLEARADSQANDPFLTPGGKALLKKMPQTVSSKTNPVVR